MKSIATQLGKSIRQLNKSIQDNYLKLEEAAKPSKKTFFIVLRKSDQIAVGFQKPVVLLSPVSSFLVIANPQYETSG